MSRYATLTDAELVRRCRADDSGAWNELVERYSDMDLGTVDA